MIEVPMTSDTRKYQPKTLGPFNWRQVMCICIGAVIATPIAFLINTSWDNRLLIGLLIAAPFVASGWVKFDGLTLEGFFVRYLYYLVLTPPKRRYIEVNTYKNALKKVKRNSTSSKTHSNKASKTTKPASGKSPDKQITKKTSAVTQQKKRKVIYSNKPEYRLYT